MKKARQPALLFIFVTLVMDILGMGMIAPILPNLVSQLKGGTLASGALTYGWILSIYALLQFVFAPLLGALSDRFGRRKVILVSLLGGALDFFILAWAPTLFWFVLARMVSGITAANFSAAAAYIADISPREKKAANFGIIGAAFGLGFALGPALGGWIASLGIDRYGEAWGIRLPFVAAGGLALLNCLYGYFVLPESLKPDLRKKLAWADANPFASFVHLARSPFVLAMAAPFFLFCLGHQVYQSTWALFAEYRFDWGPAEIGHSLAFVGIMAALVQGGLARGLVPALGEPRAAILGTVLVIAAFVCYGLVRQGWMVYPVIVLGSIGGIATLAIRAMISNSAGADEQGRIQGSLAGLQSLASIFGPLMLTGIFSHFISGRTAPKLPGAPFYASAILTSAGLFLLIRALRKEGIAAGDSRK